MNFRALELRCFWLLQYMWIICAGMHLAVLILSSSDPCLYHQTTYFVRVSDLTCRAIRSILYSGSKSVKFVWESTLSFLSEFGVDCRLASSLRANYLNSRGCESFERDIVCNCAFTTSSLYTDRLRSLCCESVRRVMVCNCVRGLNWEKRICTWLCAALGTLIVRQVKIVFGIPWLSIGGVYRFISTIWDRRSARGMRFLFNATERYLL